MRQTAPAQAGDDMPGLRAFITGNRNDLYGILAAMIFPQSDADPLCNDRAILIDAAAARRLALFDDHIGNIIKCHESIPPCPGLPCKLSQNLIFDNIYVAFKQSVFFHFPSSFYLPIFSCIFSISTKWSGSLRPICICCHCCT
jgi:hypothetical protein